MYKRKVFQIITLSESGGAQHYINDLVEHSAGKYEYTIISAPGGAGFKNTDCKKLYLEDFKRKIDFTSDYRVFRELIDIFKLEKPDIVHCHSSKAGFLGRLAAWHAGIKKVIYTVHGFVFREPLNPLLKLTYYLLEKWLAAKTDVLICVSRADYELALRKKFRARKIVYIPNGVDFTKYRASSKKKTTKQPLRGICIANFYKTKGHKILIEALNEAKSNIVIDFAGDFGPEKAKITKLIKKYELTEQIHFLGFRSDIPKLLSQYDFFILTSLKEGFPYVILEALASELPVISTRTGGIPDIVKHKQNGYLCTPGSVSELKDALIYVEQGGEFKINKSMLKDYAVQNTVKKITSLY